MTDLPFHHGPDTVGVPKRLRSAVLFLIDAKLKGEKRVEARAFARHRKRTCTDIDRLMERLSALPDVERDGATYARLSDAREAEMRAERAAGVTPTQLAAKYGVARSTVYRICADD